MAYNLESLIKIIRQTMDPHYGCRWITDSTGRTEIETLMGKALSLQDLIENFSPRKIGGLESQIRDAAYEAEDILESHLADRIRSANRGAILPPPGLQKVIGEFDSAEEEIKKMMGGSIVPDCSSPVARIGAILNPKEILVGLGQDSFQLKDRLTGHEAKLVIIPIVGMAGIGKTTLSQTVYNDPLVISHFDTRAWITISQEYNVGAILLGLLECVVGKLTDEMRQRKNEHLAVELHKCLCKRRYLIVLDDMWDTKAWDDVSIFFPDDRNGSRVMVTTREEDVANYAGSNCSPHHQMRLLNEDESWDLLRKKIFAHETCPSELEGIGEKIARDCRGLPLAIHVMSGLLSQIKRTHESWVEIARDVSSVVASNNEQFSKILLLSYNHLPEKLKPCFLYMSTFPEDYEIRSSYLIRLWVAEGFLKPVTGKSLEEAAEMYLKDLVRRNLIFVRRQKANGTAKSYGIHDLLRKLCVREARREKFFCIKNWQVPSVSLRRVSVHSSYRIRDVYYLIESMPLARSFLCMGMASQDILSSVFFSLKLLRVLDILGIEFYKFPKEMLELVNLRYLAFACRTSLPYSVSSFQNLQTIIFREISRYPVLFKPTHQIFGLAHLRHIIFKDRYPNYDWAFAFGILPFHENLQTLSGVTVDRHFNSILGAIPNLKKLGVFCYYSVSSNINLTQLHLLETLKCSSRQSLMGQSVLSFLIFPPSLKKITLHECRIPAGFLNKIGSLPNLEVLKLRKSILESTTWEASEGEFNKLQFLLLEDLNLVEWVADESNFPRLCHFVIRHCSELDEIPSGIGEIACLEIIEVHASSPGAVASARKIQEEQLELGNDGLLVLIKDSLI